MRNTNNQRRLIDWLADKPSRRPSKYDQKRVFGGTTRGFDGQGVYRSSQWKGWNYSW